MNGGPGRSSTRSSTKLLVPAAFALVAGVLVALLFVSAEPTFSSSEALPESPAISLPWDSMIRDDEGLRQVQSILERGSLRERFSSLESIYASERHSPAFRGVAAFAAAVLLAENRRGSEAVELFRHPDIQETQLAGYALLYIARELKTSRPEAALAALEELSSRHADVAVVNEARLLAAELLRDRGRSAEAMEMLRPVALGAKDALRGEALDELASLLAAEGRHDEAVLALETLYYELPRHPLAAGAARQLTALRRKLPPVAPLRLYTLGVHRARLLMEQDRYSDAYQAFADLLTRHAEIADEDWLRLQMGLCHYRRRQLSAAVAQFRKVRRDDVAPEALYYLAEIARRLRQRASYLERAGELLSRYPKSSASEDMLLSLARYHEDRDERDAALDHYRRLVRRFPSGKHVLDARWRLLWEDFKAGRYAEAGFGFEEAARERPGSDQVSKFLYWAGRAYQEAGRFDRAEPIYRQVLLGYQNTYYGRRALEHLSEIHGQRASLAAIEEARKAIDLSDALRIERVGMQQRVIQLYASGLEREAIVEAESAVSGRRDDASFLALSAWIHADRDRNLDAFRTLRAAFPFHVSATGDLLPRPIWEMFYPLAYWDHVERYSTERSLDPYLVSGLIRQESTFNPRVRSRADARGLMQILPSTGRLLARQERRRYDLSELYNPEINIRYGTRYLRDVLQSFSGRMDYALASYNAGPHRVKRWTGMDLTIPSEVFIEEIPFNETRDYVKLVLRNEMLYRRLYGGASATSTAE